MGVSRNIKAGRVYNAVLYHCRLHTEGHGGHGEKPNTNRRDAFEKLVTAAGGKLVGMYATMTDGPGSLASFDADPTVAASVGAVAASSDGVHNFKMVRLFTMEEVIGIRKKRIELKGHYSPPGE